MLAYPFTSILDIMKPSKIDKDKKSHIQQLEKIMCSPAFVWEEKLDGISIMAIGGRLFSNVVSKKTGWPSEKTLHLPQISGVLQQVSPYLILDGEVWKTGLKSNGVTSITNSDVVVALSKQAERGNLEYHVYDILRDIDGTWLVTLPYKERRKILQSRFIEYLSTPACTHLKLNPVHFVSEEDPNAALEDILSRGLEGIVLKSLSGTYQPGKRPMWNQVKLKASLEDDVVIMGFEPATRKYTGKNLDTWEYWENGEPVTSNYALGLIGSIKVGKYDLTGKLSYVGKVTGITDSLRKQFTENPGQFIDRVIVIKAMEKTEDDKYRHANFLSFHPDKRAEECKLEENDYV